MKFWKSLSNLIEETLPDWRDKFLSYKELKKQLKLIYPKDGENSGQKPSKRARLESEAADAGDCEAESRCREEEAEVEKEVTDFVRLLEDEIDKFNGFFVEKEEEYVIKWKELQDRLSRAKDSNEELMKVGREIVDFHGEMVLLENYSALNYTGLVKILKKYDKRSGALIRLPFIQKVLKEPFFSTEVLDKIVKECETTLEKIFSKNDPSSPPEGTDDQKECDSKTASKINDSLPSVTKEPVESENMEGMYTKTMSALRVLKEIRSGSSTVSVFSLPPLQSNALDEDAKNLQTSLEQEAK